MRVREWYSWHFPELCKIVTDNIKYAQVKQYFFISIFFLQIVHCIGVKESFGKEKVPELVEILDGNEDIANEIMTARDMSMGQDIADIDLIHIRNFTTQILKLADQRQTLTSYLASKLSNVAPNLQTLLGDVLAAKLIAHSGTETILSFSKHFEILGSLTNLAKYPASTIQILGAEKALFRALKTKGNTPKYGLLFQSSFIGRAALKNKGKTYNYIHICIYPCSGRISRYLANKCSLAARIDYFAPIPCNIFGEKMKEQVIFQVRFVYGHRFRLSLDYVT